MNKINYNSEDIAECITGFRRLAEELREDIEFLNRMSVTGEISPDKTERLGRLIASVVSSAENNADMLGKFSDECEKTEEKVLSLVRKSIFEQHGSIIVEKSKKPVSSSMVSGKSIMHDASLEAVIFKSKAGELK